MFCLLYVNYIAKIQHVSSKYYSNNMNVRGVFQNKQTINSKTLENGNGQRKYINLLVECTSWKGCVLSFVLF